MKIRSVPAIVVLVASLAACSQEQSTQEAAESPAGVEVTAAPGVAFDYRYSFSLPAAQISAAQETHAAACEKLGIDRCRITGMRYKLLGENRVEGMLAFKLDPTLARAFGKQGIAAIEQAEGQLIDAEITGVDAGAVIDRAEDARAEAQRELNRIDGELARGDLSATERAELQRQRADIATQIAAARETSTQQRESLANTPMTFDYLSGKAIRGFDPGAPFTSALDLLAGSAQATLAFVLGAIAILGPPALILLLGWLAWRRLGPRFVRSKLAATAPSD